LDNAVKPEESAVAKSTGLQEKKNVSMQDVVLSWGQRKDNYHEGESVFFKRNYLTYNYLEYNEGEQA